MTKPNHIEAGKLVGLRIGLYGEPFITLLIQNEKNNITIKTECLIDTGFNGYLQITKELFDILKLELINKSKTKLADGSELEIGITTSTIKILDLAINNFPIQIVEKGSILLGTRMLMNLSQMLILDCSNKYITLTMDKKVKKKVCKTINKYAK